MFGTPSIALLLLPPLAHAGQLIERVESGVPEAPPVPAPVREVTALALEPGCAITLDGALSEPCWQGGLWIGDWLLKDAPSEKPAAQTEFRVRVDAEALYIAVRADEPNMGDLRAAYGSGHDVSAWNDDCIEVWIEPDNTRRRACHLIFSIAGGVWDGRQWTEFAHDPRAPALVASKRVYREDPSWNSAAEVAFARHATSWTGEIRLPLADFGLDRVIPGSIWAFNIGRERWARAGGIGGEFSSLTGVFSSPMEPFAHLRLGLPLLRVTDADLGALGLGENQFRFTASSPRGSLRSVEVRLTTRNAETQSLRYLLPLNAPAPTTVVRPYVLPALGDVSVDLELLRPGTEEVIYRRSDSRRLESAVRAWPSAGVRYFGRDPWWVDVELLLGRVTLARAQLRVTLLSPQGRVLRRQKIGELRERMRLHLNLRSVRVEGDHTIRLTVLDGKQVLGETDVPLRLLPPPL